MIFGTFLTWTDANTTSMIGHMSDLITDLTPLLIPIIAIAVGLIVVSSIIKAIRG